MRHDDESSTAQRVSRILDLARGIEPSRSGEPSRGAEPSRSSEPTGEDGVWPDEWPPGAPSGPAPGDSRPADRFWPGGGPRWQVPVPAAVAAAVLALLVVGLAAALLLRGHPEGTVVPARAPAPFVTGPTGTSGPGPALGPAAAGGSAGPSDAPVTPARTGAAGPAGLLRVYVVGQVRRPGVVSLSADARVEDAVQAVGGATAKADLAVMNLARKVVDGERIVVPRPGEKLPTSDPGAAAGAGGTGASGDAGTGTPTAPVDLNTATVAQLDTLPGVGPVIAGRIVAWRQENGRFATVDDLSEVQGIGDATMARLRPLVRV